MSNLHSNQPGNATGLPLFMLLSESFRETELPEEVPEYNAWTQSSRTNPGVLKNPFALGPTQYPTTPQQMDDDWSN